MQKQKIKDKNVAKRFIPFVTFKIFCSLLFVLIHIYFYRGGDTFSYFTGGNFIADQILDNPENTFSYLFGSLDNLNSFQWTDDAFILYIFNNSATLAYCQIATLFNLLAFKQFLTTTILISLFSTWGLWAIYSTLCKIYPKAHKLLALAILFYPTLAIWSSGILKDTITMAAVGLIFQSIYRILLGKKVINSVIIIIIFGYACLVLKAYILYTFMPAMLLWTQAKFSGKINNPLVRVLITPFIISLFLLGGFLFLDTISESAGKYSLDNVQEVAEGFQSWHTYLAENRNQSGYYLGEIDFTPLGILQTTPAALFVTFYRPHIFEIRNVATAFESVQAMMLLLITIYLLFRIGFLKFFRLIINNDELRAFVVFSILLGVAVGVTSYNFGALSRYKIPCLPFFTSSLAILYIVGLKKTGTKGNRQ